MQQGVLTKEAFVDDLIARRWEEVMGAAGAATAGLVAMDTSDRGLHPYPGSGNSTERPGAVNAQRPPHTMILREDSGVRRCHARPAAGRLRKCFQRLGFAGVLRPAALWRNAIKLRTIRIGLAAPLAH